MSADPIASLSEAMQAVVDDLRTELAAAQARIAKLEEAQVTPERLGAALIEGSAIVAQHGEMGVGEVVRPRAEERPRRSVAAAAPAAAPAAVTGPGGFRVGQRVRVQQGSGSPACEWIPEINRLEGPEVVIDRVMEYQGETIYSCAEAEGNLNPMADGRFWFRSAWLTPIDEPATPSTTTPSVPFDEAVVAAMLAVPAELRGRAREIRRRYAASRGPAVESGQYAYLHAEADLTAAGVANRVRMCGQWTDRYAAEPDWAARLAADEAEEGRRERNL